MFEEAVLNIKTQRGTTTNTKNISRKLTLIQIEVFRTVKKLALYAGKSQTPLNKIQGNITNLFPS